MAIESFKKSELRANTINRRVSGFETVFDRGIIFWLNNIDDNSQDIINKLSKIEVPKDFNHDGIFLVDNKKVEFIFNSIEFAKRKFPNKTIQFTYFNTGLNSDNDSPKNGTIMPIQYLASNIIPIKIELDTEKNVLILCSRENFEEEELIKLMGLAKNITANYQSSTIIAFPDYNRLQHEQIVGKVKQIFEESAFANSLLIENFNSNFRN
ncbi:hypothetical protein FACS1894207_4240 [Bacteroidia bacterium]|nr:hypothetical protein FACS1894207_4240 [Bacteroidia bacterium]